MSVTIKDIMKLPCMKNAEIAAGRSGEDNVVTAVTVLEYPSFSEYQDKLFHELAYEGSDIIITAFSSIAGEPGRLLAEIMSSHNVGEAGVIIYYFDLFVKKLDQAVIEYADEVGYPIILMPRDQFQLRYSEAISEIQELILEDRNRTENFSPAIMDTFMSLPRSQQNATSLLRLLSNYLHLTFLMTEADMSLTAFSGWPTILEREAADLLRRIAAGTFSDPCYVIDLDGAPGRGARLIVVSPGQPVKSSALGHIADVTRLLLKVLAEESPGAVRAAQLIRAVVGDEPVKVRRLAKDLGVRTENLRNMILYRKPHPLPAADRVILEEIRELLGRYCRDFVADVYSGEIVVLLDDGLSTQWLPSLRAINEALRRRGIEPLCAYAKNLENTTETKQAYQDISGSLEEARSLYQTADIFSYHEILYVKSCKEIMARGQEAVDREMKAMKYLSRCGAEVEKDLVETLSSFYFDSHMSVTETANNLYIHVNTVKYRMRKIAEATGCRVTDMPEMLELYKAMALHRLCSQ